MQSSSPYKFPFLRSLQTMSRVVTAIILRETKTRFGKYKMGYLWALIEPSSYVAILLFIRNEMHTAIPFGQNLFLFLLTGILVYRVFISIAGRAINSISANKALLTYPLVKPLDPVIARIVLEILTMSIIGTIFFTLLSMFSDVEIMHYPNIFAEAILAVMLLGASVGVFNAILSCIFPSWERIWSLLKFPLLFLSGIFYIPRSMPPLVQSIISWNPVLHCVEWLRYGSYLDYDPLLDKSYVIWFALVVLVLGLLLERIYRNSIVRS